MPNRPLYTPDQIEEIASRCERRVKDKDGLMFGVEDAPLIVEALRCLARERRAEIRAQDPGYRDGGDR